MPFNKNVVFATLVAIPLVLALLALSTPPKQKEADIPQEYPALRRVYDVKANTSDSKTLNILFIGNSYTYYNNMLGILKKIADSDIGNKTGLKMQYEARAYFNLQKHWDAGEAQKAIRNGKWDFVVLQEHSLWPMDNKRIARTTNYTDKWVSTIRLYGAKPLFFMTWPRKTGSSWYDGPENAFMKNATYMQSRLKYRSEVLSKKFDMPVVPVGAYWTSAGEKYPDINLYETDETQPSLAGAYLNALVFYKYFTQQSAKTIKFAPDGISTEQAQKIREIADLNVPN